MGPVNHKKERSWLKCKRKVHLRIKKREKKNPTQIEVQITLMTRELFVSWWITATSAKQISGMDLPRQFYMLPHWGRSCRSHLHPNPVMLYWHPANQYQHSLYVTRCLVEQLREYQFLRRWYVWLAFEPLPQGRALSNPWCFTMTAHGHWISSVSPPRKKEEEKTLNQPATPPPHPHPASPPPPTPPPPPPTTKKKIPQQNCV